MNLEQLNKSSEAALSLFLMFSDGSSEHLCRMIVEHVLLLGEAGEGIMNMDVCSQSRSAGD